MKAYYDNTLFYQEVNIGFQGDNGMNIPIDHTILEKSEEEMTTDETPLDKFEFCDQWHYYYHPGTGDDYSKDSFEKFATIDTIYELWSFFKIIKNITHGLHFLVKNDLSPCWDDPVNSHLWWIKRKNISHEDACNAWADLAISAVGLSIFKDFQIHMNTINSVSVSYKDGDYVFKIMMNTKIDDHTLYNTIPLGKNFSFDFVKGGRLIENTGGKKKDENKPKKYTKKCKNFSPKKNYRQPLKVVN